MNNYEIKLKHKNSNYREEYRAFSFPEAARRAYMLRAEKGLDWEIASVKKLKGD